MPTAVLHDGATVDVTVRGEGPAILLPVSTRLIDDEAADRLRAWGGEPNLGHALVTGLADAGFRVIAADYEGHLAAHPKPTTLTADTVAADLLAIADAAGADRFAYYGYSWLALSGLQLAIRTDRLTALAMGGYPPLGGPYPGMLAVTHAAHREALAQQDRPTRTVVEAEPGDWDSADVALNPEQTQQYVSLYESLQGFDERTALERLTIPRFAFAGADDTITYGPRWGDTVVAIGEPLTTHGDELAERGWRVEVIPSADHMKAMHSDIVLPLLVPWLRRVAT